MARYAAGSLRDAENLLEQLVVSFGDEVTLVQLEELLGLGNGDRWLDLVKYLLMGNTSASLETVNQAAWDGVDLRQMHRQTLELLRASMLLEWGAAGALELPEHVTGQLAELAKNLPHWRIVKALKIWGQVNMRYDAPSTLPLELAIVEICSDDIAPPAEEVQGAAGSRAPATQANRRPAPSSAPPTANAPTGPGPEVRDRPPTQPERSRPAPVRPVASQQQPNGPASPPDSGDGGVPEMWQATVKALGRATGKRYNLGALLRDCKPNTITLEGDTLLIPFVHRPNMERMQEELEDPNSRRMVTEAVTRFFGTPYDFKITLSGQTDEASQSSRPNQHSPLVRTAMNMGARIVEDTIE